MVNKLYQTLVTNIPHTIILDFTAYSPTVPIEIPVSDQFGKTRSILLEGSVLANATTNPTLTLVDDTQTDVFTIEIDPNLGQAKSTSELKVNHTIMCQTDTGK